MLQRQSGSKHFPPGYRQHRVQTEPKANHDLRSDGEALSFFVWVLAWGFVHQMSRILVFFSDCRDGVEEGVDEGVQQGVVDRLQPSSFLP